MSWYRGGQSLWACKTEQGFLQGLIAKGFGAPMPSMTWRAGNVKCEVVGFMRKIMNGSYYPWAPRSGAGYVDIDDVAAAHTLAMLTPKASGRCDCYPIFLPQHLYLTLLTE